MREYRFDYSKSRSNRFVGRVKQDAVVADVAEVFRDPARVNSFLRAAIEAFDSGQSEKTS